MGFEGRYSLRLLDVGTLGVSLESTRVGVQNGEALNPDVWIVKWNASSSEDRNWILRLFCPSLDPDTSGLEFLLGALKDFINMFVGFLIIFPTMSNAASCGEY